MVNKDISDTQRQSRDFILNELLSLYERVRSASLQELRFISVNETHSIVNYDQAALWEVQYDKPVLTALSGVADPDKNGAYGAFLKQLYKKNLQGLGAIRTLSHNDITDPSLKKDWLAYLPAYILCIPLQTADAHIVGTMMFARAAPWLDSEHALIEKIANIYSHDFSIKQKSALTFIKFFAQLKGTKTRLLILLAFALLMMLPCRASVLAPAEIIAHEPDLIRASIDGVIEEILVNPNQKVKKGQLLVKFDRAALQAQQDITRNTLNVSIAELRQTSQAALNDPTARARLSFLQGKVQKEETSIAYYQELLSRSEIKAPKDGTVIFEDAFDWRGRPVSIGERIMLLANETKTELEIHLPVHDAITLKADADVVFFSNARPDSPLKALLSFHSYRANKTEADTIAYRLKATWAQNYSVESAHLGLRGTAKIYGEKRLLIWQILRKPSAKIRQFFGL
jgi:hypothetical protein